jgi:hypothetical protein
VLHLGEIDLNPNQLEAEMEKVHKKYGIYPVIIFEVERGGTVADRNVMNNVRSVAKELAHLCNVLIVISESNAILHFGKDLDREEYIFVDELSIPEATAYLKKHLPEMTAEEMKMKVFDQIGTNPANLHNLMMSFKQKGIPVETFVNGSLHNARKSLSSFPLQRILKALKDLPDPGDGVDPEVFENQQEIGVALNNAEAVGAVSKMATANPILYRMDTGKYHLLSTAHKTALRTYDPKVPPPPQVPPPQVPPPRTWAEFLTGKGVFY